MRQFRLSSWLGIKGSNIIKVVQLEGVRVIGNPSDYAMKASFGYFCRYANVI